MNTRTTHLQYKGLLNAILLYIESSEKNMHAVFLQCSMYQQDNTHLSREIDIDLTTF
jgi:hypothetical protein